MPQRMTWWAVALAMTIVVACAPTPSEDRVSIRLKWLHQAQFAGFYAAERGGLYREEGINVELRPGGVDYPAVQMVASGGDDFGVTGADQILVARSKGVPLVAVACVFRKSPFVLFSLRDSGIEKLEDTVGRPIGVKLGGNEELTYRAMVKAAGIDARRMVEVPVKFDISPLLSGDVFLWPGYSINEPLVAIEKGFAVNLIWPERYGIHLYADVLFTTEETLRTRKEVVRKVVRASMKGWERALRKPEEAVTWTLSYSDQLNAPHERAMLAAAGPLVAPDDRPIGWMDRKVWVDMQALLLDGGFIDKSLDVDEAFRLDFLQDAVLGR